MRYVNRTFMSQEAFAKFRLNEQKFYGFRVVPLVIRLSGFE